MPQADDLSPIPAEEWEQAGVPVGGAYDGQSPQAALFVVPVGIQTVREIPALAGSSGTVTASAGAGTFQVFSLMSADPHRRAVWVGGISGTPRVSASRELAQSGGGLPLPSTAAPIRLQYAGELYVVFPTATDSIGFLAEIDQD